MTHKKGLGSSYNGCNSNAQRLGIKRSGGQIVNAGEILVCQNDTHYHLDLNVDTGGDDTLFALKKGAIEFGCHRGRHIVSVKETI